MRILRENPFVAFSIALPVLVIVLFAAATLLPRLFTAPPAHDLLLLHESRSTSTRSPFRVEFAVLNNEVTARIYKLKENERADIVPRVFLFDHVTSAVREVQVPIPQYADELSDGTEVVIPGLAGLTVSSALQAPDGYEFQGHRRNAGLVTELFGGNRNRTDVTIGKSGAIVRIRLPTSDVWYNDVRFLGWVTN